jgi:hypothetical protein
MEWSAGLEGGIAARSAEEKFCVGNDACAMECSISQKRQSCVTKFLDFVSVSLCFPFLFILLLLTTQFPDGLNDDILSDPHSHNQINILWDLNLLLSLSRRPARTMTALSMIVT